MYGREKTYPQESPTEYISDDETSDKESDPCLRTTPKERHYGMIPGLAQATQATLSYSRAQTNPTVEHRPSREPDTRHSSSDTREMNVTNKKTDKESK